MIRLLDLVGAMMAGVAADAVMAHEKPMDDTESDPPEDELPKENCGDLID